MSGPTKVLVIGRVQPALKLLQSALIQQSEYDVDVRLISSGDASALRSFILGASIVVVHLDGSSLVDLKMWADAAAGERLPALVVIGPGNNTELMRSAFRSGARDYITEPVRREELLSALGKVVATLEVRAPAKSGQLIVFVGAAGGVGTSLVAANVAHMLASVDQQSTLLLDLDLMFAPLAHYLDLKYERGLAEALAEQGSLDEHALAGYGAKHASGLRLLGAKPGSILLSQEMSPDKFVTLLQFLLHNFRHVIVDAPHHVDPLSAQIFSMASCVYIVMQQSVLQVRNAVRLNTILRNEIGLPKDRIRLVVNRVSRETPIELDDIRKAVDDLPLRSIPNHFKSAIESLDTGVPLLDSHPNAPVTRGLMTLRAEIAGAKEDDDGSFLRRALPSWMRRGS